MSSRGLFTILIVLVGIFLVTDSYPDLPVCALVFTFGLALGRRSNLCHMPVASFMQIPWPRRWMRGSSSLARDNS